MNRRHFFKALAGSALVATAGCTGGNSKTSEDVEVLEAGVFGSSGRRFMDFKVENNGESGRFEFSVERTITEGDRKGETDENNRVVFLPTGESAEVMVATTIPGISSSGRPEYEFNYSIERTERPLPEISVPTGTVQLNQDVVFKPENILVSEDSKIKGYEWNINCDVFLGQVISDGEIQKTKEADHTPFYVSEGEMTIDGGSGSWVHLTVTDENGRTGSASEKYGTGEFEYSLSLAGEDLRGRDFIVVDNMSEVNLEGLDLTDHSFSHVDLSEANLKDTDLSRTYMIEANLEGADLRGANLAYAELKNANFQNADLRGATISSRAQGADFTNATWSDGSTCSTKSCDGRAY